MLSQLYCHGTLSTFYILTYCRVPPPNTNRGLLHVKHIFQTLQVIPKTLLTSGIIPALHRHYMYMSLEPFNHESYVLGPGTL